jgi:glucose-6-phosphate-specific signal transduction histidine kinase
MMTQRLNELEASKAVEGQIAKELRDTVGQDIATPDLKNKVRSRARRLNLLEQLPIDVDPLTDNVVLDALNSELQRLMGRTFDNAACVEYSKRASARRHMAAIPAKSLCWPRCRVRSASL